MVLGLGATFAAGLFFSSAASVEDGSANASPTILADLRNERRFMMAPMCVLQALASPVDGIPSQIEQLRVPSWLVGIPTDADGHCKDVGPIACRWRPSVRESSLHQTMGCRTFGRCASCSLNIQILEKTDQAVGEGLLLAFWFASPKKYLRRRPKEREQEQYSEKAVHSPEEQVRRVQTVLKVEHGLR